MSRWTSPLTRGAVGAVRASDGHSWLIPVPGPHHCRSRSGFTASTNGVYVGRIDGRQARVFYWSCQVAEQSCRWVKGAAPAGWTPISFAKGGVYDSEVM